MSVAGAFSVKSQREVARYFKEQPRTIERWRAEGMPGKRGCYDLQEIMFWAAGKGKLKIAAPKLQADDPMMVGDSNSEALERYRLARAQREEIKLAEDCEQVIKRDRYLDFNRTFFAPLRLAQETFKRKQDHDAFQIVDEAIDEMGRRLADFNDSADNTDGLE